MIKELSGADRWFVPLNVVNIINDCVRALNTIERQTTAPNNARGEIELLLKGALVRLGERDYNAVENCLNRALATLLRPVA